MVKYIYFIFLISHERIVLGVRVKTGDINIILIWAKNTLTVLRNQLFSAVLLYINFKIFVTILDNFVLHLNIEFSGKFTWSISAFVTIAETYIWQE